MSLVNNYDFFFKTVTFLRKKKEKTSPKKSNKIRPESIVKPGGGGPAGGGGFGGVGPANISEQTTKKHTSRYLFGVNFMLVKVAKIKFL